MAHIIGIPHIAKSAEGGILRVLARFVRMTLSFSKSELMHKACLLLFLHRYNLDKGILLK